MNATILEVLPEDSGHLSQIAWQSKSHWNYPQEWMELWRKGLTITTEIITQNDVYKLVLDNGEIIGFTVLITEKEVLWIEHLWILPEYIGHGFGKRLLQTALKKTVQSAHQTIKVVSDINAEVFYQKMGFETVSQYESVPKGRFLPVMQYQNPPI